MDRWETLPIACTGGLIQNLDVLTQGTNAPGSATILQNYEPALNGGYQRILGLAKFSDTTVTGDATTPVLGVKVGLGGVIACRKNSTSYDLFYSSGSAWTKINTANRTNAVTKMRGVDSDILGEAVILVDGANHALKYDGSSDTLINGTGAPANPAYAATFRNRLVLAGYSANPNEISISEPNSDIGFNGANGAASIPTSDIIVGLLTFRDNLYIFCKNSIKVLVGDTSANFAVRDITTAIGCVSGDTIRESGGDVLFLAPDGIRSLAATERYDDLELSLASRQIVPALNEQIASNFNQNVYSSLPIRQKSQYRLFINDTDVDKADQIGFLGKLEPGRSENGMVLYSWATLKGIQPYCADSSYENNQEIAVIGDPENGYVHRLESGNSLDGAPISYIYRTPDLTFNNRAIRKVIHKLILETQVGGDVQFNVKATLDKGVATLPQPAAKAITQTGATSTYGSGLYGTAVYSQLEFPTFDINQTGSGRLIGFEFFGEDTDKATHRIDAMTIIYGVKGYR